MTTAMYAVEGMMCESCMAAVLEKIYSVSGVTVVTMDLVAGGQSPLIVTSGTSLEPGAVRDAVEHVGFGVPLPKRRELGDGGRSPVTQALPPMEIVQATLVSTGGLS